MSRWSRFTRWSRFSMYLSPRTDSGDQCVALGLSRYDLAGCRSLEVQQAAVAGSRTTTAVQPSGEDREDDRSASTDLVPYT